MLRFPNPGSTTQNFVAVFRAAIEKYRDRVINLDDLVRAIVEANLATSSGHMGEVAISRSTRRDRSRDPLYNQLKMYAELFRSLGWLRSMGGSALDFTFTLLGEQVAAAGRYWRPLLAETILGIAFPSHVLKKQSEQEIRPFAAILRTMLVCDNALSRDEMIVGPLSAASDRSDLDLETVTGKIKLLRTEPTGIQEALVELEAQRQVQANTLRNYTRWPLAIMRDLGWTVKERIALGRSPRSVEVHRLTQLGKEITHGLQNLVDLRIDQVDRLPFDQKRALCRHAHFAMMGRVGFNLSSVADQLLREWNTTREAFSNLGLTSDTVLLFSPFQSLSIADSNAIFPSAKKIQARKSSVIASDGTDVGRGSYHHLYVAPSFESTGAVAKGTGLAELKTELLEYKAVHKTMVEAAQSFADSHSSDTQQRFYPLITRLFQLLGFRSQASRLGVNYQRWDACVWLQDLAVPIEIKSPAEEEFLSTKAVRQALENKVVLLARGGLDTRPEITSLIVGYKIPNERGEMSMLIDDIYNAFGINIGVLDLRTMGLLAMRAVTELVSINEPQLSRLRGFLNVGLSSA